MKKRKIAIFFFFKKKGFFFILRSLAIPFCVLTWFVKHVKRWLWMFSASFCALQLFGNVLLSFGKGLWFNPLTFLNSFCLNLLTIILVYCYPYNSVAHHCIEDWPLLRRIINEYLNCGKEVSRLTLVYNWNRWGRKDMRQLRLYSTLQKKY